MQGLMRIIIYPFFFVVFLATSDVAEDEGLIFSRNLAIVCLGLLLFVLANLDLNPKKRAPIRIKRLLALMFGSLLFLLIFMAIEARVKGVEFSVRALGDFFKSCVPLNWASSGPRMPSVLYFRHR